MQCTNMTFKVLAFYRKLWRLKIILEQIKLILDLVCRRHFCTWRAYTRSLSCENLKNTRLNVFALSYTTLILWPALEQSTGFFSFVWSHTSLGSTVLEIFVKTGMLAILCLLHWKTVRTRYTHSLRSCVALGSIKKAPEGGGWAYSQAGASVHGLVANIHGLPEIFL